MKANEYFQFIRGNKTIREVSKGTGISESYLYKLEQNHRKRPGIFILEKIAKFNNIPLTEVLKNTGYFRGRYINKSNKTQPATIEKKQIKNVDTYNKALSQIASSTVTSQSANDSKTPKPKRKYNRKPVEVAIIKKKDSQKTSGRSILMVCILIFNVITLACVAFNLFLLLNGGL
jgi:transcriptional regulator with XRE-family HTH domain